MIVANISCRLSCFGNYSDLTYRKEDVIRILSIIDDSSLSPSVIQEINPIGQVSQRMQFSTQNGLLLFAIHSDRIDVSITSDKKQGFSKHDKSVATNDLFQTLEKVLDVFADRADLPYRLAWNPVYIVFELSEDEKQKYKSKFIKEIEFFKESPLDEVLVRYASRKEYSINERSELINVLTTVSSVVNNTGTDNETTGYRIEYDINTWQGNKKSRFENVEIKAFISQAIEIQKALDMEFIP